MTGLSPANFFNGSLSLYFNDQQMSKTSHKPYKPPIDVRQSWLDRVVISITDFLGSIGFLLFCLLSLAFYLAWNMDLLPWLSPIDPYPFNGMDSVLSILAIVIAVCVLIGQNRLRRIEKVREQVEFEVNVKAENEITKILEMLHDIQKKLGIDKPDPELEKMKETTDIAKLHEHIDKSGEK